MFRKIKTEDKDFYINAVEEFYDSDAVLHKIPKSNIIKTFEELISSAKYAEAFIIEENNEKAGYALITKTFSQEAGGLVFWIEEIFILPKFRGLGLCHKFLEFIKQNYDVKRLRLEYTESNKKVMNIYEKCGFKTCDYKQMIFEY